MPTKAHNLTSRYIFMLDELWGEQSNKLQLAHYGMECRILRAEPFEGFKMYFVVFDDGFITKATEYELFAFKSQRKPKQPNPME